MNRRKFLKACLSAGVAMTLENVRAVEFCESVPDMIDAVRCKVGLKSNVVAAFADEQEASQWCWAACIQMIFAYHVIQLRSHTFLEVTALMLVHSV